MNQDTSSYSVCSHRATRALYSRMNLQHQNSSVYQSKDVFFRPPRPLIKASGGRCLFVERLFNHRGVKGFRQVTSSGGAVAHLHQIDELIRRRGQRCAWSCQVVRQVKRRRMYIGKRAPSALSEGMTNSNPFVHRRRGPNPPLWIFLAVICLRGTSQVVAKTLSRITLNKAI